MNRSVHNFRTNNYDYACLLLLQYFCFILLVQHVSSQPPYFQRSFQIGSSGTDTLSDMISSNSSVIIYGTTGASCSLGGSTLPAGIYVSSYNKTYSYQWGKTFSYIAPVILGGVAVDFNNNIVISGSWVGNSVLNFGGSNLSTTESTLFLAKFDSSGNHIWSVQAGRPSSTETIVDLVIGTSGSIYAVGYFQGGGVGCYTLSSGVSANIFVIKFSSAGSCSGFLVLGGSSSPDLGNGIAVDANEDLYLVGEYTGSDFQITIGGTPYTLPTPTAGNAGLLAKVIGSSLSVTWYKTFGEDSGGKLVSVAVDSTKVYALGVLNGPDVIDGVTYRCNGTCLFMLGITTDGITQWIKYVNGTFLPDSITLGLNNIYVTGQFLQSVTFATGYSFTGPGMFLGAFSPVTGNHVWSSAYAGAGKGAAGDSTDYRVFAGTSFTGSTTIGGTFYTASMEDIVMMSVSDIAPSPSPSVTPSITPTPSTSSSRTPTPSVTPSTSPTRSVTPTSSVTASTSPSSSSSPSSTSSPSNSPSPSVTVTPTPTQTHTENDHGSKKNNDGAVAAATVVVLVVLGAAVAAVFYIWRRGRRRQQLADIELTGVAADPPQESAYVAITPGTSPNSSSVSLPKMSRTNTLSKLTNQDWIISYAEIELHAQIGAGAFGEVFKGIWRGVEVAVKKLLPHETHTDINIQDFFAEAELMKHLKPHPNITQLLGVCESPLCIVTEFVANGSLHSYIHSEYPMDERTQIDILKGTAAGMLQLHSQGVIHRDLAARNILIDKALRPKVSDFGMSRVTLDDRTNKTEAAVGPIKWMAPEALMKKVYNSKTDVWSFGIVVYEVMTRKNPYEGSNVMEVGVQVAMGLLSLLPEIEEHKDQFSPVLVEVIQACLHYDPKERPEFQDIIAMLGNA